MNPRSDVAVFLAHAVVLEDEAASRYIELAEIMETHHNNEVAELFRQMAGYSRMHLAEAAERAEQHAGGLPDLAPWEFDWPGHESPESSRLDGIHYLMTPHHALKLALEAECSARDFYAAVAAETDNPTIRQLGEEFAAEEAEHAEAVERWLERYPEPDDGWDEDLDPPVMVD